MYKRYVDSKVQRDNSGQRYLSQTIYPEILTSSDDLYIISVKGDRLDVLAGKYLGDVGLWYIIGQANHLGKGTLAIPPGLQIRIPAKSSISQITKDSTDLNNS